MEEYISKATVTEISATSRVAIKIKDNFYTVEYSEKRSIVEDTTVDMDKERAILFADVNRIVDDQCEDIISSFKK